MNIHENWRRRKLLLLLYLKGKINRTTREYWVRPSLRCESRKLNSIYYSLELQKNLEEKNYHNFYRMSQQNFDELLKMIRSHIEKHSQRESISPGERLSLTLRYLASGDSMVSIANQYHVGISTVSVIIRETCDALWTVLSKIVLPTKFTQDLSLNIEKGFRNRWNLPHCIGSLDGKHITIQAPPKSGSDFFNYKNQHSIVLMALCDWKYKFTYIDVGAQGRQSDGGVFRRTEFYKKLKANQLNIPGPSKIDGIDQNIPYFFAADEAFPLGMNIMRPFPGRFLEERKSIFNYRLSRGRRVIENSFGILVSRWRVLRKTLIASLVTTDKIILACVCLHNWLLDKKETNYFVDFDSAMTLNVSNNKENSIRSIQGSRNNMPMSKDAIFVRNALSNYFIGVGAIPPRWNR